MTRRRIVIIIVFTNNNDNISSLFYVRVNDQDSILLQRKFYTSNTENITF